MKGRNKLRKIPREKLEARLWELLKSYKAKLASYEKKASSAEIIYDCLRMQALINMCKKQIEANTGAHEISAFNTPKDNAIRNHYNEISEELKEIIAAAEEKDKKLVDQAAAQLAQIDVTLMEDEILEKGKVPDFTNVTDREEIRSEIVALYQKNIALYDFLELKKALPKKPEEFQQIQAILKATNIRVVEKELNAYFGMINKTLFPKPSPSVIDDIVAYNHIAEIYASLETSKTNDQHIEAMISLQNMRTAIRAIETGMRRTEAAVNKLKETPENSEQKIAAIKYEIAELHKKHEELQYRTDDFPTPDEIYRINEEIRAFSTAIESVNTKAIALQTNLREYIGSQIKSPPPARENSAADEQVINLIARAKELREKIATLKSSAQDPSSEEYLTQRVAIGSQILALFKEVDKIKSSDIINAKKELSEARQSIKQLQKDLSNDNRPEMKEAPHPAQTVQENAPEQPPLNDDPPMPTREPPKRPTLNDDPPKPTREPPKRPALNDDPPKPTREPPKRPALNDDPPKPTRAPPTLPPKAEKTDNELLDDMLADLNKIQVKGAGSEAGKAPPGASVTAETAKGKDKDEIVHNDTDRKLIAEIEKIKAVLTESKKVTKQFNKGNISLDDLRQQSTKAQLELNTFESNTRALGSSEPAPNTEVLEAANSEAEKLDRQCSDMDTLIRIAESERSVAEKRNLLRDMDQFLRDVNTEVVRLTNELNDPSIPLTLDRANAIQTELRQQIDRSENGPVILTLKRRYNALLEKLPDDPELIQIGNEGNRFAEARDAALESANSAVARLSVPPPGPPAPAINPYHFFAVNEVEYDAQKQKVSHLLGKFSVVEKKADRAELAAASLSKSAISADNRSKIINNIDTQIEELKIYRALLEDNLRRKNSNGTDTNTAPPHQPRDFRQARPINNTPAEIQATIDKATACIGKLEAAKNVINAIPAAGAEKISFYSKLDQTQSQSFGSDRNAALTAFNAFAANYNIKPRNSKQGQINGGNPGDKTLRDTTLDKGNFNLIRTEIPRGNVAIPVAILQETNNTQTYTKQTISTSPAELKKLNQLPLGAQAREEKIQDQIKFMVRMIETGLAAIKDNGPIEIRNFESELEFVAAAYCRRMGYEVKPTKITDNLKPKKEQEINAALDKLVAKSAQFAADIKAAEARIDLKKGLLPTPESKRFR